MAAMSVHPVLRAPSWIVAAILALAGGLMFALGDVLLGDPEYGWRGAVLFGAAMFFLVWARMALRKKELRRRRRD